MYNIRNPRTKPQKNIKTNPGLEKKKKKSWYTQEGPSLKHPTLIILVKQISNLAKTRCAKNVVIITA